MLFGWLLLVGGSIRGANFDSVGLNVAQCGGFLVICVSYWVIHVIRSHKSKMEPELDSTTKETELLMRENINKAIPLQEANRSGDPLDE